MSAPGMLLCGLLLLLTASTLTAQELRDTVGPLEQKANPITPENPIPQRTGSLTPRYPERVRPVAATATVVLAATIDESGCIAEIRRGPEPLLTTAAIPTPSETALTNAADVFMYEAAAALRRWQYEPPSRPPMTLSVAFTFTPDQAATWTENAAAVPLPPGRQHSPDMVRIGSILASPRPVRRVEPVYPPQALAARVEGVVIVEVRTDATGRFAEARVLRSVPLLDQAALDAVRQWVYAPTCFGGTAIPSVFVSSLSFKLP